MRPRLAALLLAILMAGCGGRGDDDTTASADPQTEALANAHVLLRRATDELPDVFSVDMRVLTTAGGALTYQGTFDKGENSTYLRLDGDAATLAAIGGGAGAGTYLTHGLTIYVHDGFTLYLANGTAFVEGPPLPGKPRIGSPLPNVQHGPLGVLLRGDELVRRMGDDDARIVNIRETIAPGGADAMEILVTREGTNSTLLLERSDPPRITHIETTLPPDPKQPTNALTNARVEGTFLYEATEIIRPESTVTRSVGLSYQPSRREGNLTWNFLGSASVRTDEVEIQVKNNTNATGGDPSLFPTLWTFRLHESRRTVGNLTLAFIDADNDGAVSTGDTLVATAPNAASMPPLVLYDLTTGTRIVPGAGLALAATALALACILARRR